MKEGSADPAVLAKGSSRYRRRLVTNDLLTPSGQKLYAQGSTLCKRNVSAWRLSRHGLLSSRILLVQLYIYIYIYIYIYCSLYIALHVLAVVPYRHGFRRDIFVKLFVWRASLVYRLWESVEEWSHFMEQKQKKNKQKNSVWNPQGSTVQKIEKRCRTAKAFVLGGHFSENNVDGMNKQPYDTQDHLNKFSYQEITSVMSILFCLFHTFFFACVVCSCCFELCVVFRLCYVQLFCMSYV